MLDAEMEEIRTITIRSTFMKRCGRPTDSLKGISGTGWRAMGK